MSSLPLLSLISVALALSFFSMFVPFPIGIVLSNIGLTFLDPFTVVTAVGIYFFLGNISRIIVFRYHLRQDLFWHLLPGVLIGGLSGTYLLSFLPEKVLAFLVIVFAFIYVTKNFFSKKGNEKEPLKLRSGLIAGISTGILSAIGGPGGTLRGAYLADRVKSLQELNGATASIGLVSSLANTLLRVSTWKISWTFLAPLLLMFPVILTITFFGKSLMDRLNWSHQTIRLVTNGAVMVSLILAPPSLFR